MTIEHGPDDHADGMPRLPKRVIGANLPADAYLHVLAVGRARVPDPPAGHWSTDEKAMLILLNGLRRWEQR